MILQTLRSLSSAEDFFRVLEVPFDARVLHVCRLHILKRMGEYMRADPMEGVAEEEIRSRCRGFLERAYRDFVESSPIEQRVFKVLKDAVKPKSAPKPALVSLGTLR